MFKQIMTLVRGRSFEAAEAFTDQNALAILRQQLRDCAGAVAAARRAIALAIAQNEQEQAQCQRIEQRLTELEARALAALAQGKQELAQEAAEALAALEAERDASKAAQSSFTGEITRLRHVLRESEARLKEVERGQRIATAVHHSQCMRESAPGATLNALRDAESTLSRLRRRQQEMDVAAAALCEMEQAADPARLVEKLAAAGCGPALRSSAEDVLKRLQQKLNPSA